MAELRGMDARQLEELDRLLTMPPETRYAGDPVGWAVRALGIPRHTIEWSLLPEYAGHTWDGTKDPLKVMLESLAAGKNVGIESATGTGKTFTAMVASFWYHATHKDALVVTTAPKEGQLTDLLWKEIGRKWPEYQARYPMAEMVKLRVRMRPKDEGWNIIGWACGTAADEESATRAQGFHAENMLIVVEEMPGVALPVLRAFQNTAVGTHNLILGLGNPDNQQDTLHQFCTSPGTVHIRISALDHPNVVTGREIIPGACTRKSVAFMAEKYKNDLPWMYDSRARGICPEQSAAALIKGEWVDRAFALWEVEAMHQGAKFAGVDVANSEAGDKGAIARGKGAAIEVEAFPCPSALDLGDRIADELASEGIEARYVAVDTSGIGASTADQSRRRGYRVQPFNGGPDPIMADGETDLTTEQQAVISTSRFKSKRGQGYWALREDLASGRLALRPNTQLRRELLNITFRSRNGYLLVESKDDIRARAGASPDMADAVMYANWIRPRRRERIPEPEISAFDPKILQAEYDTKYRFRSPATKPVSVDLGAY